MKPIYFGLFKVVKKISDNPVELDLPSMKRKHRVINISFLKNYSLSESFSNELPLTTAEMLERLTEISGIVGVDKTKGVYYCTWSNVNPTLTCGVPETVMIKTPVKFLRQLLDDWGSYSKIDDVD